MGALIRFREGLGKACLVEVPAAQGPGPTPEAGRLPGGSHVICAQPALPQVTLIADPRGQLGRPLTMTMLLTGPQALH